ncbi:MAG: hypothetical protein VYC34_01680 [Planctomycetota bacterium]|nr:hypothetical protein [Planctomycetota bacterium]
MFNATERGKARWWEVLIAVGVDGVVAVGVWAALVMFGVNGEVAQLICVVGGAFAVLGSIAAGPAFVLAAAFVIWPVVTLGALAAMIAGPAAVLAVLWLAAPGLVGVLVGHVVLRGVRGVCGGGLRVSGERGQRDG